MDRYGRRDGSSRARTRRYNRPPMPVVDPPQERPPATGSDGGSGEPRGASSARSFHNAARSGAVRSVIGCVVLAAISAAVLPTVPSYDPWSWIVWGKEVTDPHLSFVISGGPSWKPLPFLFTTVYGPFDSAAPTLWVITARAGGLLGLVGGLAPGKPAHRWRLGRGLGGSPGDGRHRADPGLVLLLFARDLRGRPDRRLAVGDRPVARRPQGPGLPADGRRRADPAGVVAVHRPVCDLAVVHRTRVQEPQDAGADPRRPRLAAVLLVRAAVDRLGQSVPGRHPRGRVQRPSRA